VYSGRKNRPKISTSITTMPLIRFLSLFLFLLPLISPPAPLAADEEPIRLRLSGPALRQVLQAMTPIEMAPKSPEFTGTLTIDTVRDIRLGPDRVDVSAILVGRDIVTRTTIAGRSIALKLGQISLPIHCRLSLRLDGGKQRLLVRPQCSPPGDAPRGSNALLPLLSSLTDREITLDPAALLVLPPPPKTARIRLSPVKMTITEQALSLVLRPEPIKSR